MMMLLRLGFLKKYEICRQSKLYGVLVGVVKLRDCEEMRRKKSFCECECVNILNNMLVVN